MRTATVVVFLLCSWGHAALGQQVRGRVTSQESREPLVGVFVMLLDSTGGRRAAALTDTAGVYRVQTPVAGTYTVAAERLGYTSMTSAPFVLHAGAVVNQDLSLAVKPVVLPGVNVRGSGRCESPRDRAAQTAELWEEARKALTVASWAAAEQMVTYELVRYSRELTDGGRRVLRDHVEQRTHRVAGNPWQVPAPEFVVEHGFMQKRSDGLTDIFVPGAEILLSPIFLSTHCFEVRVDRQNRARIGLGFRPIGRPNTPDVEGTLWLDRRSLALQTIEYQYLFFQGARARSMGGGTVEFVYLPSGLWITGSWLARLYIQPRNAPSGRKQSLVEDGNRVVRALAPDSSVLWSAPAQSRLKAIDPVLLDSIKQLESGTPELPILSAAGLAAFECGPREGDAEGNTDAIGFIASADGQGLARVPVRLAWARDGTLHSREGQTNEAGVYSFCDIPPDQDVALSFAVSGSPPRSVLLRTRRGVLLTRSFFLR